MPDRPAKSSAGNNRLDRIEAAQKDLLAATTKLESRIDILYQEFQRAATAIRRLGLAQESGKTAARRREEALGEIRGQLTRIETKLAER